MKIPNTKYLVLADQALFSGLSFVTTIWIARNVDAVSFGIYSAWVLAIYLFVSAIGAWVIQPFQIRYNKLEHTKEYLTFVFWGQFTMMVVAAGLIFFSRQASCRLLLPLQQKSRSYFSKTAADW